MDLGHYILICICTLMTTICIILYVAFFKHDLLKIKNWGKINPTVLAELKKEWIIITFKLPPEVGGGWWACIPEISKTNCGAQGISKFEAIAKLGKKLQKIIEQNNAQGKKMPDPKGKKKAEKYAKNQDVIVKYIKDNDLAPATIRQRITGKIIKALKVLKDKGLAIGGWLKNLF